MISSFTLRRLVLTGVLLMFGAHLLALLLSGQSAMSTPISQLSRASGSGGIHTGGLILLALVQLAVAVLLSRTGCRSRLWTAAVWLTVFNGACLLFIAMYFLRAPASLLFGPDANDPLAVLASSVGVIMGLLQKDLRQIAPRCARYNAVFFVLWLALIPVIPFIDGAWLGAYERTVGAILLAWLAMLALLCPDGSSATRA
ncbi:DUF998 domain-containing protein [Congregibacter litoralis]|uniref:Uncharacterized protein n=1 Tax=Congregibacter litoralis KT71 TaxID=314285 RepID=A4A730_9GAMM|nr:DUF998 domain-containing protein [Congregibacter litoralis]EAQ98099.1 hypothetical protein KT71_02592 [Congregibacter litoralis KT71]